MTSLSIDQVEAFFEELHDHPPYPWQRRLTEQVVDGDWPDAIDLPTGSGKTACLDAAVFALAAQADLPVNERTAPRRIFFCVNRRVIVDEAHERARRIAHEIWHAEQGEAEEKPILRRVAAALRRVAGDEPHGMVPPLDVLSLRGGIYRDNRWARSLTQPTILCTTLDQLGSRLLFRGYGVSPNAAPIQAALIAYDSLVLLDEAHISRPFLQTLDSVEQYLDYEKWAETPIGVRPMITVPMTATPADADEPRRVIRIEKQDRGVEALTRRLEASKPALIKEPSRDMVKDAVNAAIESVGDQPTAVGIIVNRVATARAIYEALRARRGKNIPDSATIELVIGSMRPIDRDEQSERLRSLVGSERPSRSTKTSFIVATQCLEVGADYDFDALVTECASMDALRQRFGRLNRAGRDVEANAVILAEKRAIKSPEKLDESKPLDPIYGNALARTWHWLNESSTEGIIDFGIDSLELLIAEHFDNARLPQDLLSPAASRNAPVVMPAYVDLWCQTSPRPTPEPEASLFIHGEQDSDADVQVCWRADISESIERVGERGWTEADVVALLPPTSAECMRVPISRARKWLTGQLKDEPNADKTGDTLGADEESTTAERGTNELKKAILWRGAKESVVLESANDLRPGDTIAVPIGGMDESDLPGHLPTLDRPDSGLAKESNCPPSPDIDRAEASFKLARDRIALRLHPDLKKYRFSATRDEELAGTEHDSPFNDLLEAAERWCEEGFSVREWRGLLKSTYEKLTDAQRDEWRDLDLLSECNLRIVPYPDRRGVVLTSRERLRHTELPPPDPLDDGDDSPSWIERGEPVLLDDHAKHVLDAVHAAINALPLTLDSSIFERAAEHHDIGKADERFQAMLTRTDRTDAWLYAGSSETLLAKSDGAPLTRREEHNARERAELPEGFRHEMVSLQLAEQRAEITDSELVRELILHLIAAHHGYARPFAPVVSDDELPSVACGDIRLDHELHRSLVPPHRVDSGIPERFWKLTRRFGWWGLAYLEAVLRLSDQQASAAEDAGVFIGDYAARLEECGT